MDRHGKCHKSVCRPFGSDSIADIGADCQETELCVCELVGALQLPQPKISRHCKVLSEANLLVSRREAQWVLYSLADDMPDWSRQALEAAVEASSRMPNMPRIARTSQMLRGRPYAADGMEKQAC